MIRKQERRSRNDQTYAFVSFSDPTGMFEVMLFPEVLAASRPLLEAGKSVLVTCSAEWDGDELKLRAASIADLDAAAANAGEGLRIHLEGQRALGPIAAQLKQPGKGIVTLVVPGARRRGGRDRAPQAPPGHRRAARTRSSRCPAWRRWSRCRIAYAALDSHSGVRRRTELVARRTARAGWPPQGRPW